MPLDQLLSTELNNNRSYLIFFVQLEEKHTLPKKKKTFKPKCNEIIVNPKKLPSNPTPSAYRAYVPPIPSVSRKPSAKMFVKQGANTPSRRPRSEGKSRSFLCCAAQRGVRQSRAILAFLARFVPVPVEQIDI